MHTPASTFFCCHMVCGLGFSMQEGRLTEPSDLFADPFWGGIREHIAQKAVEMRKQGFFGPAMLPMSELEYGGGGGRLQRVGGGVVGAEGGAKEPGRNGVTASVAGFLFHT